MMVGTDIYSPLVHINNSWMDLLTFPQMQLTAYRF